MNEAGTSGSNCAETVPGSDVREWLGATRRLHDPESPIGHRCTNLLELLESLGKEPDRDTRANILKNIDRQKADLERLLASERL